MRQGDSSEETVELFVVTNGELDVARSDALFLVVESSVSSEFENFGSHVLQDSSEEDWSEVRRRRGGRGKRRRRTRGEEEGEGGREVSEQTGDACETATRRRIEEERKAHSELLH